MTAVVLIHESSTLERLSKSLNDDRFEVLSVVQLQGLLPMVDQVEPGLILLDDHFFTDPDLELVRKLRSSTKPRTAIVILTDRQSEKERVFLFDCGVDLLLPKAVSAREFRAQMKAVLRRTAERHPTSTKRTDSVSVLLGRLVINHLAHQVLADGQPIELTLTEFRILSALVENPGIVVSTDTIRDQAIGHYVGKRTIDVHVFALRRKLRGFGVHLKTVRSVGFIFDVDASLELEKSPQGQAL